MIACLETPCCNHVWIFPRNCQNACGEDSLKLGCARNIAKKLGNSAAPLIRRTQYAAYRGVSLLNLLLRTVRRNSAPACCPADAYLSVVVTTSMTAAGEPVPTTAITAAGETGSAASATTARLNSVTALLIGCYAAFAVLNGKPQWSQHSANQRAADEP